MCVLSNARTPLKFNGFVRRGQRREHEGADSRGQLHGPFQPRHIATPYSSYESP